MARNTIVIRGDGRFIEGILGTGFTPKPGTAMMIKGGVAMDGSGNHTYIPWDGAADGEQDEVIILRENEGKGGLTTTAYADSEHIYMYIPVRGDELLVLFGDVSGTGASSDVAVGDKLMIDDVTGKAIPTTGSPEMEPFKALEAIVDATADQLILVRMIA